MGRWGEAASDLENARKAFGNKLDFQEILAEVYAKLGKADLSGEARRQAEKLRALQKKKPGQAAPEDEIM
jgi:Tfp pilus assembly protein PilF